MDFTLADLAGMIDHSLLPPSLTVAELEQGCELARDERVASVCILPYYLRRCAEILEGSPVKPSTTIGFPHGGHATAIKLAEAERAIEEGCQELDMVINISKAVSEDWDYVQKEIEGIVRLAHDAQRQVKVIFENCYLTDAAKIRLCQICGDARADWVKTSTGFGSGGATIEDVKLMREHSPPHVQVKAAGGIRSLDRWLEFRPYITRFGCSRTREMLDECRSRLAE